MLRFSKEEEELLRTQELARIATFSANGYPHIAAMWFGFDGETIYIATDSTSKKIANIERDNKVAVLIDTQLALEPHGVLVQGTAEILKKGDDGFEKGRDLITERFPDEKSYEGPKQRIIRIRPIKTAYWKFKPGK